MRVIKLGGSLLDDAARRAQVLRGVAQAWKRGEPIVIVHGGGKHIDAHLKRLGIEKRTHAGLRVTDDTTLEKAERKRRQIAHAESLSKRAKLVKLADKICNLRDMVEAPPATWPLKRKLDYFEWAKNVGLKSSPSPRCLAQSTQRWKCSGLISLRSTGRFVSR